MGTRCAVWAGSIARLLPGSVVARSVTLDCSSSKRYRLTDALADPLDHATPHADATPGGRLAKAPADGGHPASRLGVDTARDPGDHGGLPVAAPGDPIVPRRGDPAAGRPRLNDERRGDRRALSPSPRRRVSGRDARVPRGPPAARSRPGEPAPGVTSAAGSSR